MRGKGSMEYIALRQNVRTSVEVISNELGVNKTVQNQFKLLSTFAWLFQKLLKALPKNIVTRKFITP
jgi:hypothetical protein